MQARSPNRLKQFKRALLNNTVTQAMLAALLACYIRLVYVTSQREMVMDDAAKPYLDGTQQGIFAFWHGRMMMMPTWCPPGRGMHILISQHRDGLLISRVISHFNQKTVVGSSSRGGAAAVREIVRIAKSPDNIGITPDGPRGPFQQVSQGTIGVAKLTGLPLIPVTFSTTNAKRMRSWDRFLFARPFGRIFFLAGAPLHVARDAQEEPLRSAFEQSMQALTARADEMAGVAA